MRTDGSEEARRRAAGLVRLANRLGCPSPSYISDALLSLGLGMPSLDPVLLEKWLIRCGYYVDDGSESIRECIVRRFGEKWAALAESLI